MGRTRIHSTVVPAYASSSKIGDRSSLRELPYGDYSIVSTCCQRRAIWRKLQGVHAGRAEVAATRRQPMVERHQDLTAAQTPKNHSTVGAPRRYTPGVATQAHAVDRSLRIPRVLKDGPCPLRAMMKISAGRIVIRRQAAAACAVQGGVFAHIGALVGPGVRVARMEITATARLQMPNSYRAASATDGTVGPAEVDVVDVAHA